MQGISGAAMMLLQDAQGQMAHDVHLTMIYVAIGAISLLVLVVCLLVAGAVMGALAVRAIHTAEKLEKRAGPIMDKANELMAEFTPKLRTLADNVEHISTVARGKVDEVGDTVTEINRTVKEANGRTRAQVERVDGMVSNALTATGEIAGCVQQGIRKPILQVAGIVAAVRVGVETLIERSPFGRPAGGAPRAAPRPGPRPVPRPGPGPVPTAGPSVRREPAGPVNPEAVNLEPLNLEPVKPEPVKPEPVNPGRPYDVSR